MAGDIGCYTLGVLKPFEAMDSVVCMGASLGVGLGLRHVLPPEQARRVVSVIGDSTFVHSGISGLVEMVYNPPADGHVLIILDNGTTAMTGHQENPATGRKLDHEPTYKLVLEDLARCVGVKRVHVVEPRLVRMNSNAFWTSVSRAGSYASSLSGGRAFSLSSGCANWNSANVKRRRPQERPTDRERPMKSAAFRAGASA